MKRFIEGETRTQMTLIPEGLDDYVAEENPVRVVDVFVDELDLGALGFEGVDPAATGRPAYHPAILLKIYIYGYLNRIQSSRRVEREAERNVELMWLTGRLAPDFKTIADFRKNNSKAIRSVCRQTHMPRKLNFPGGTSTAYCKQISPRLVKSCTDAWDLWHKSRCFETNDYGPQKSTDFAERYQPSLSASEGHQTEAERGR